MNATKCRDHGLCNTAHTVECAERFIDRPRSDMLGRMVEEVFNDSNRLGRIVLNAFTLRHEVSSREIEMEQGRRVQLSLDFISERGAPIGALLTASTAGVKPTNPHNSPHYGKHADCNLCHHQHEKSENYCTQCHKFDFKLP